MQTARRLYLYLMAAIGLGVMVSGISLLLTTLFEALGLGGGSVLTGEQALRERLTLATAMTAVSLPVWLIHWLVAERGVRPGRPDADLERSSAVRGLFLAAVLGATLIAMFVSAQTIVESAMLWLAGTSMEFRSPASALGVLVAAGAAWGYHLRVRRRDWRDGRVVGAGAWLPRAYLYIAVFVGLFVLLSGIVALVQLVGEVLSGGAEPVFGDESAWWSFPLAAAVSSTAVGGATWLGHWWYANRLWADAGERGVTERSARLRFAFYVAVLVAAATAAIAYLGQVGRMLLNMVLGTGDAVGEGVTDLVVALVAAAIFGVAWTVHAGWMRAAATDPAAPARADRLTAYPTALVGLAFGAVAVARLVGVLLDTLAGSGQIVSGVEAGERAVAEFVPYAVIGIAVWLWHWSRMTAAFRAAPVADAASTIRRAALLIALAVAILAGVASLGVILYRLFGTLFGLDVPGDVVAELSTPIGTLIVAAAVAAYHGQLLRRDGVLRTTAEQPPAADGAPAPIAPELAIRLTGPIGADAETLSAVARSLADHLPEGYELRDDRRMS